MKEKPGCRAGLFSFWANQLGMNGAEIPVRYNAGQEMPATPLTRGEKRPLKFHGELVGGFVGGGFGFGGEVEDEALEEQSRPSDDAHISESRYRAPGGI